MCRFAKLAINMLANGERYAANGVLNNADSRACALEALRATGF